MPNADFDFVNHVLTSIRLSKGLSANPLSRISLGNGVTVAQQTLDLLV